MPFEVKVSDSLHQKLDGLKIRTAMAKAMKQAMYDVMKESMTEAPGPGRSRTPNPTGNLRRSHSIDLNMNSDTLEGLLKNSANYWQYVQFGTSKMDADDFVTRALSNANPGEKMAEYFSEYYKP